MTVYIQKLDPRAQAPERATAGSAGADLHALLDEVLTIPPGGRAAVPTGIAIGLPSPETVGLVFARSGLAVKHGLALSNGVGVIDSDYTGEIRVGLVNLSDEAYTSSPASGLPSQRSSGNERQNGANPHEYRVFDLSLCFVILV